MANLAIFPIVFRIAYTFVQSAGRKKSKSEFDIIHFSPKASAVHPLNKKKIATDIMFNATTKAADQTAPSRRLISAYYCHIQFFKIIASFCSQADLSHTLI